MHGLGHEISALVERRRLPGYLGLVAVDEGGTVRYVSADLDGRFGLAAIDVVGRSFLEYIAGPDAVQAVDSFAGTIDRAGFHQALQVGIRGSDGLVWQADVVAENCLAEPGIELILLNLADTSDRLRSVQLLDAQSEVVRQLALGRTTDETIGAVLRFVERTLPAFRAAAYLTGDIEDGRASSAPSLSPAFTQRMATAIRSDPSMPGAMAMRGSETIVADDLDRDTWASARATVGAEHSSIWSVPVCHERGGRCVGVIEVYGPHVAHPRDEDWVVLRLVSRLAAAGFDRLRLEKSLIAAAEVDPLTSAPNRRVIKALLAEIIDDRRSGHAVCFVDLDRLKVVNDSLGHEAGDELIREAARRLIDCVGDLGVVGRFGGDEFVAVAHSPETPPETLAERCRGCFEEPVLVAGRRWRITASVGVVRVDGHRTPGDVLRDADAAMYEAKRSGRNRWHLFDEQTRDWVVRRLRLEQQLAHAIDRDELDAFFQPVVRCDGWALQGLETLARWPGSGDPWVTPTDFVPLAEELGYIEQLGSRMIAKAFEMVEQLDDVAAGRCTVAVNVSPLQLQSPELYELLAESADRGRRVDALCLEMTEQHMVDDSQQTLEALDRLLGLGVGLAVDDFGTGYSSLGSLHRLPAHTLKLDRRLTHQVNVATGRSVVAAVIGVAQAFGMSTVAEGVETVEQALALRDLGVDAVQGYLFAPPMSMEDTVANLRRPWPWAVDREALSCAAAASAGSE